MTASGSNRGVWIAKAGLTLQWLGHRETPFTLRLFQEEMEMAERTARYWLTELEGIGLVHLLGPSGDSRGKLFQSAFRISPRGKTEGLNLRRSPATKRFSGGAHDVHPWTSRIAARRRALRRRSGL